MLIERLVYRMEYGEPLSMSWFSFLRLCFGIVCHVFSPTRSNLLKSDMDMSWGLMTDFWVDKRNRVAGIEPATLK